MIDDQGPALLEGWTFGNWPPYYHLETTAGTTGQIEICISYDETDFGANEEFLHLGQYGDTAWSDITSSFDPVINNRICAHTDRLGDFAIAIGPTRWEPPPPYVPPAATGEKRKQLETLCGRIGSIFNLSGLALPVAAALIFRRRLVRSRRQP